MPAPLLISTHIPKTAGTSFRRILETLYSQENIWLDYDSYPLAPGYWRRYLRRYLSGYYRQIPEHIQCIHGHAPAHSYRSLRREKQYITWVRDPVERVASHYYFWQTLPVRDHPIHRQVIENKLSLEEFARIPLMRNVQSLLMSKSMQKRLCFAGITEQADDSMRRFNELFAPGTRLSLPQANRNPNKSAGRYPLSAETRARISNLNQQDMALYDSLCQRFGS